MTILEWLYQNIHSQKWSGLQKERVFTSKSFAGSAPGNITIKSYGSKLTFSLTAVFSSEMV